MGEETGTATGTFGLLGMTSLSSSFLEIGCFRVAFETKLLVEDTGTVELNVMVELRVDTDWDIGRAVELNVSAVELNVGAVELGVGRFTPVILVVLGICFTLSLAFFSLLSFSS